MRLIWVTGISGAGKSTVCGVSEDLERVLGWNQDLERLYRELGARIIDGSRPLDEVVEAVLDLSR